MFGLRERAAHRVAIDRLHAAVVETSRAPALYGPAALPDSVDGRFESLILHLLVLVRRLRALPPPAGEVAQELVDAVFAHLEIAMRESGVGDLGVAKRMKKLARSFYDRVAGYEIAVAADDADAVAAELGRRLDGGTADLLPVARAILVFGARLGELDLDRLVAGPLPAAGDLP